MPNLSLRHLPAILAGNATQRQIGETIRDLLNSHNSVSEQVNASPVGRTPAPQPHAALSVKGGGGILDVAITDNSPQYAGNEHFFNYSADGGKTWHTKSLGPAKNWRGNLGPGSFLVESYAQQSTSPPSAKISHPAVSVDGPTAPPMQAGQGSGTGTNGYGEQPYNTVSPPKRA